MIVKSDLLLLAACVLAGAGLFLPGPTAEERGAEPSTQTVGVDSPATVEGTVLLPPAQPNRRRFRGRAYRQRTDRGGGDGEQSAMPTEANRYPSVIVSAHPLSYEPTVEPLDPVEIDQKNRSFAPQVTPITPGTTVEFVNSDPFYHNVFSLTPGARFNIGRRPTGVVVEEQIPHVEGDVPGLGVVELHCDIHPQMNAFIVTLETPYFTRVSDDGTFRLTGLPPGRYRLLAYAPRQDPVSVEVDLGAGERISRTLDLR